MKLGIIVTATRCWILVTNNWLSNQSQSVQSPSEILGKKIVTWKKIVTSKCSSPHLDFRLWAILEGPTTSFGYEKGPAEIRDFVLLSVLLNEETKLNCFVCILCLSPFTLRAFWKRLYFIMFLFSACSTAQISPLPRAPKSYHRANTFLKKEFPLENDN